MQGTTFFGWIWRPSGDPGPGKGPGSGRERRSGPAPWPAPAAHTAGSAAQRARGTTPPRARRLGRVCPRLGTGLGQGRRALSGEDWMVWRGVDSSRVPWKAMQDGVPLPPDPSAPPRRSPPQPPINTAMLRSRTEWLSLMLQVFHFLPQGFVLKITK